MAAPNNFSLSFRPISPINYQNTNQTSQFQQQHTNLSANEVSRIVGLPVKQGEAIKGQSRITYMPYEKKVIEYEDRQYIERKPVIRKVINYEQRKVVEEVPRQVITTDYYAVENIKQYYKEIIPEKKIQMVPVEKKIRKIQYIPIEKQIVHYPEGQDPSIVAGQSRLILQRQGVTVRQDAEFKPIDPKLIYNYSNQYSHNPIGYVEDGYQRNLSTAPTIQNISNYSYQGGYYTGPSQTSINTIPHSPRENINGYRIVQDINIYPNYN